MLSKNNRFADWGEEMEASQIEQIHKQYEQYRSIYNKFCEYLKQQLDIIIENLHLQYYELSYRVKSWDSILEKIERHNLQISTIQEIHDVIGFRIIALFKSDIPILCDTIRNKLEILREEDKASEKPADVFGYLSIHFQIKLPKEWTLQPTAAGFSEFEAELQIRTFSQHIWAAASHILQYKHEAAVPDLQRRSIYRLAAVLEIVDNELEQILAERKTYQESLQNHNNETEQLDQQLDIILLEKLLDSAFGEDGKLPHEPYDKLLWELFSCNVSTVGELSKVLESGYKAIQQKETKLSIQGEAFYSHAGKLRIALEHTHKKEYSEMRNKDRIKRNSK